MKKIKKIISNILDNILLNIVFRINAKWYYFIQYYLFHGHFPNFKKPNNLSEYLLMKQCEPEFKRFAEYADKIKVRDYVSRKGLADILPKVYQIVKDANHINFDTLPEKFVLKTNHGCGSHIFCKDKSVLDIKNVIETLNKTMKAVYSIVEPHYKFIEPLIYAEEFIDDKKHQLPIDYKFMMCGGDIGSILVCSNRDTKLKLSVFNTKWENLSTVWLNYKNRYTGDIEKPKNLDKMIEIAKILGKDFEFVRVDLYDIGEKIFFSELTLTPAGGYLLYYTDFALQEMYKPIAIKSHN
jgi:glycosyltransferase involved in cell wall biosynthesis